MANLTDNDLVRSTLALESIALPDAKILPHLVSASGTLKRWISESTYATSLALIATARTGLTGEQTLESEASLEHQESQLRFAETYLVISRLIPTLNLKLASSGGIQLSVFTKQGTSRAMNPTEVEKAVNAYVRQASRNAQDYLTTSSPRIRISRAKDEAGDSIT